MTTASCVLFDHERLKIRCVSSWRLSKAPVTLISCPIIEYRGSSCCLRGGSITQLAFHATPPHLGVISHVPCFSPESTQVQPSFMNAKQHDIPEPLFFLAMT